MLLLEGGGAGWDALGGAKDALSARRTNDTAEMGIYPSSGSRRRTVAPTDRRPRSPGVVVAMRGHDIAPSAAPIPRKSVRPGATGYRRAASCACLALSYMLAAILSVALSLA